jgi:four helix bundle protein
MPAARLFTELLFWQKAREWSKRIFQQTRLEAFRADQRLVVQINDSSSSVMANIAEGFGRGTQGEFVQFLGYAIGSLNETQSHLCAAFDRGYIAREEYADLFRGGTEIRKLTVGFLQAMVKQGSGVKHVQKLKSWTDQVWETYERLTGKPRPALFVAGSDARADEFYAGKPRVIPENGRDAGSE